MLVFVLQLLVGEQALIAADKKAEVKAEAPKTEAAEAAPTLAPMDKLLYRVEEDPSSGSKILGVSSLGDIYFPVSMGFEYPVVAVKAKGLTMEEIKKQLQAKLEAKYYKKATVKLTLVDKTQKVGQALFLGECRGVIQLPPGEEITLATAIAKLGPSEFANLKKVQVFRVDKATGVASTEPIVVDVDAILNKGDRSKDIILQDEDRVKVPEKRFLFQ